jgi:hypothetical protein
MGNSLASGFAGWISQGPQRLNQLPETNILHRFDIHIALLFWFLFLNLEGNFFFWSLIYAENSRCSTRCKVRPKGAERLLTYCCPWLVSCCNLAVIELSQWGWVAGRQLAHQAPIIGGHYENRLTFVSLRKWTSCHTSICAPIEVSKSSLEQVVGKGYCFFRLQKGPCCQLPFCELFCLPCMCC